ncbi:MAG TPA: L,D-transpeptidase [Actinomycetota bacterium]
MMTLIGLVDAITGPLAVGIFYLVPIGLVTYARGRWVGTLMAAAADKLRALNELRAALNEEEQAKPDRLQAMVELRRVNSQVEIAVASFKPAAWQDGSVTRRPPVLALVAVFLLSACASSTAEERPAHVRRASDLASSPGELASPAAAVEELPPLLPGGGDFTAGPRARFTPMWDRPGAGEREDFLLDTKNPHGELTPLLVERARYVDDDPWYEVLLPIRPNGATAWVRGRDVDVREADQRIEVDLSRRLLWHYVDGELAQRLRVGVGTPATPTGVGRFFVWVKVHYTLETGPYGFMALGLSGFSPVLSDWPGEGRMAIHGTANAGDRGRAVSHGCVRVLNDDLVHLVDVPLGTPVEIRA